MNVKIGFAEDFQENVILVWKLLSTIQIHETLFETLWNYTAQTISNSLFLTHSDEVKYNFSTTLQKDFQNIFLLENSKIIYH